MPTIKAPTLVQVTVLASLVLAFVLHSPAVIFYGALVLIAKEVKETFALKVQEEQFRRLNEELEKHISVVRQTQVSIVSRLDKVEQETDRVMVRTNNLESTF